MANLKNNINIPFLLIDYALKHKLSKELQLFVFYKIHTPGHFKIQSGVMQEASQVLGWSPKTVTKYKRSLLELGWLTHNDKNHRYYVNSFKHLYHVYKFNTLSAVTFSRKLLKHFPAFLTAAIITAGVNKMKHFHRYILPRELGVRKFKQYWTFQLNALGNYTNTTYNEPEWYGYSLEKIANDCNCSKANAVKLKQKAEALGLITVTHKFSKIIPADVTVSTIEKNGYKKFSNYTCNRIVVRPYYWRLINQNIKVGNRLELQLYDEIVPGLKIVTLKSYKKYLSLDLRKLIFNKSRARY